MTADMAHSCRADLHTWRTGGGDLFSVGRLLSRWWWTEPVWLPWTVAAVVPLVGGRWDLFVRRTQANFILIGLTEDRVPSP